jgi:hypothetical protein
LHRGLNRLDALASCSNGLTKRGLEPLIGFLDFLEVLFLARRLLEPVVEPRLG